MNILNKYLNKHAITFNSDCTRHFYCIQLTFFLFFSSQAVSVLSSDMLLYSHLVARVYKRQLNKDSKLITWIPKPI